MHQRSRVQQFGSGCTRNNLLIATPAEGRRNEQGKCRSQFLAAVFEDEAVGLVEQGYVGRKALVEKLLERRPGLPQKLLNFLVQGIRT